MTDQRTPVTETRSDEVPEWEVFWRDGAGDPLCHAGSVSAPSADVAREQAATLFDRAAHSLWLCPADEVHRYTTHTLGGDR